MKKVSHLLHGGQRFDPITRSITPPIYHTNSYAFESVKEAADIFDLNIDGRTYSRLMNPTNDIFEERLAGLDSAAGAISTSSGQAAIALSILNIAQAGDNIVASNRVYGGTWHLLSHTLGRMGIETRFVDPSSEKNFIEAVDASTRCFFLEGLPNPMLTPIPVREICSMAKRHGIVTIVDNTLTPYIASPTSLGANIIVYSTTKFIGGHGSTIGGAIVDSGSFTWGKHSDRYPLITKPDPSHGDIDWLEASGKFRGSYGRSAYLLKLRNTLQRDIGACASPMSSFLLLQGLETLPLRMKQHCDNALSLASFLSDHEKVDSVTYPGLLEGKDKALANDFMGSYGGAVLQFELRGGLHAGVGFIEGLKMILHTSNIGDSRTLATHPASTTHRSLPRKDREAAGVNDGTIRISVGLEDFHDIQKDVEQALECAV